MKCYRVTVDTTVVTTHTVYAETELEARQVAANEAHFSASDANRRSHSTSIARARTTPRDPQLVGMLAAPVVR